MLPKYHLIIGFIISFIIFATFSSIGLIGFLIIWASSVLIDFDHYLYYVFKKKDFSLARARIWFSKYGKKLDSMKREEKKKYKVEILIFHGIEFIILLVFLCLFSSFFFYVLVGILMHLSLDFMHSVYYNNLHIKFSQIYNCIKNGNKKELKID